MNSMEHTDGQKRILTTDWSQWIEALEKYMPDQTRREGQLQAMLLIMMHTTDAVQKHQYIHQSIQMLHGDNRKKKK